MNIEATNYFYRIIFSIIVSFLMLSFVFLNSKISFANELNQPTTLIVTVSCRDEASLRSYHAAVRRDSRSRNPSHEFRLPNGCQPYLGIYTPIERFGDLRIDNSWAEILDYGSAQICFYHDLSNNRLTVPCRRERRQINFFRGTVHSTDGMIYNTFFVLGSRSMYDQVVAYRQRNANTPLPSNGTGQSVPAPASPAR